MTTEADWLQWRRGGIGASDIAKAVTGLYGGPVAVVADKLGITTDDIDPALAERGHRWEQPIADAVLATHGLYVHGEQFWAEHPDRPEHRATIDGLLHPEPEVSIDDIDTLLEVKTSGSMTRPKWDYYKVQCLWQMHVTGMSSTLVAIGGINDAEPDPLRQLLGVSYMWVDRDDHRIDVLVAEADRLWGHVQASTLPEPTDGSTLEIIKQANATAAPDAPVDQMAIDDLADEIADYADLKERAKAAADRLRLAESQIRTVMGECTEARTSDGRWRVRVGKPIERFTRDAEADALALHPDCGKTVLDRERFKAEHPDDYEALKRPTADRRLTIKEMT